MQQIYFFSLGLALGVMITNHISKRNQDDLCKMIVELMDTIKDQEQMIKRQKRAIEKILRVKL